MSDLLKDSVEFLLTYVKQHGDNAAHDKAGEFLGLIRAAEAA